MAEREGKAKGKGKLFGAQVWEGGNNNLCVREVVMLKAGVAVSNEMALALA